VLNQDKIRSQLKLAGEMRPCLCCGISPRLKVVNSVKPYAFYCESCGFNTGFRNDFQSALSAWHLMNNNTNAFGSHYAECWAMSFEKQSKSNQLIMER